jgi:quinol monooxygenase YgiN
MITIVWDYIINPEHRDDFLKFYNASGEWVKFFRQAKGYIDTELLESAQHKEVFMTIDRWTSEVAYDEFLKEHAAHYEELDRVCAAFTIQERFVGKYLTVDTP